MTAFLPTLIHGYPTYWSGISLAEEPSSGLTIARLFTNVFQIHILCSALEYQVDADVDILL